MLDPSLMIDIEDYDSIASARIMGDKYVLAYYIDYNEQLLNAAASYAASHGYKVIELTSRHLGSWKRVGHFNFGTGIEEFISLIKYSECVFTNSFHGLAISLVYNKLFYAFYREHEYKVRDLCEYVQCSERYVSDVETCKKLSEEVNFEAVNKILFEGKRKSFEWLLSALNGTPLT